MVLAVIWARHLQHVMFLRKENSPSKRYSSYYKQMSSVCSFHACFSLKTVRLLRLHWPRCERVLDIHYVSSFLPTALWTKGRWLENAPPTMRQESKHLSAGVTELHPQLPLTALKLCLKWRSCMRGLPNTPTAPDFLTVCGAPLKMHDPSTQNYSINVIQLLKY